MHFASDAWLLPTDAALTVVHGWRKEGGVGPGPLQLESSQGFGCPHHLAEPVAGSKSPIAIATAVPWDGVVGADGLGRVSDAVRQFVDVAVAAVDRQDPGREGRPRARMLLAMPAFAMGKGGGAKRKGEVLSAITETARSAAQAATERIGRLVDVVLVLPNPATYALAQRERKGAAATWDALTAAQSAAAQHLARFAREGTLAPFMGAWREHVLRRARLRRVARHARAWIWDG